MVCCFAGDGAYANGVVLESLNFATQAQFTNHLAADRKFGLPIIFLVCNNHYGMTHRSDDEVMGVEPHRAPRRRLCRQQHARGNRQRHGRRWPSATPCCAPPNFAARARARCSWMCDCYRYWGHSLSDPRNEYRTKEEEAAWKAIDPIETFKKELLEARVLDAAGLAAVEKRVADRNASAAKRAAAAADPDAEGRHQIHVHRHEVRDRAPLNSPRWNSSARCRKSSASTANSPTRTPSTRRWWRK